MHISSTANQAVKHCVRLRESAKYRAEVGSALVSGRDLVEELAPLCAPLRALVALDAAHLPDIAAQRYVTATEPVMRKITGVQSCPPDVLAAEVPLPAPAALLEAPAGQLRRLLVLDGIQDPANLGMLCRTALALGWQAAVLLPGCCDPFNDKAIRASRGAVFKLPIAQCSLHQWDALLQAHGDLVALGADPDRSAAGGGSAVAAHSQQQQDLQQDVQQQQGGLGELRQRLGGLRVALCLGAEGQGLSPEVRRRCRAVSIPQSGDMESLNVATAGSILMFALSPGAPTLLAELAEL